MPHPGVSPQADLEDGQEIKYHKWYQWVAFFLFLQCMLFYLPRYFWKASENGKVGMLVGNLQDPMLDAGGKQSQINEIVNFINVIGQIYFIDFFLNGEFGTYGLDVLNYTG